MKKKRKLINIYLLIASLFLSFCLVELYMRVAKIEYPIFQNFDRERGFSLRPNVSGWWTREGKAFVKTPIIFKDYDLNFEKASPELGANSEMIRMKIETGEIWEN